jgi:DNA invertase Pin-like site-specific DNA recombinase
MARIGYARCSTDNQDATRQLQALKAAGCDPIHTEHASGKTLDREVLQRVLAELQPGDTLVIHELDRLGRSMVQMLLCVEQLLERGIGLITLDGKLNTETTDPSIVKLIVGILGYAAEMERAAIGKRTSEGRAVAQAAGVKFGRKRTWTDGLAATVRAMRAEGKGYGTIATALGIDASKVRRILAATEPAPA